MNGEMNSGFVGAAPYQPTRLAAGTRRPPVVETNVFGELVEAEEGPERFWPGRTIPVTDAMRANDARARAERERAAASTWTLKRELRVENLRVAAAAPRPGRIAERPERRAFLPPVVVTAPQSARSR